MFNPLVYRYLVSSESKAWPRVQRERRTVDRTAGGQLMSILNQSSVNWCPAALGQGEGPLRLNLGHIKPWSSYCGGSREQRDS